MKNKNKAFLKISKEPEYIFKLSYGRYDYFNSKIIGIRANRSIVTIIFQKNIALNISFNKKKNLRVFFNHNRTETLSKIYIDEFKDNIIDIDNEYIRIDDIFKILNQELVSLEISQTELKLSLKDDYNFLIYVNTVNEFDFIYYPANAVIKYDVRQNN